MCTNECADLKIYEHSITHSNLMQEMINWEMVSILGLPLPISLVDGEIEYDRM